MNTPTSSSTKATETTTSKLAKIEHHQQQYQYQHLRGQLIVWLSLSAVAIAAAVTIQAAMALSASSSPVDSLTEDGEASIRYLGQSSPQHLQEHDSNHVHSPHPVYNEEHPPLYPLTSADYIGFACATLGLMLAAGGGIGGGGILVPIYILIFGFSPKHAIPLSNVTVFGGAIANTLLNSTKRHPLADRPLVDWDLILVMEPLTIAGALIGAFCNKILPETFLVVMLVILLGFTANKSLSKAFKMHRLETEYMRQQGIKPDGTKESELTTMKHNDGKDDESEAEDELLKNAVLQDSEDPSDNIDGAKHIVLDDAQAQELDQILHDERRMPVTNIVILVTMFVVIIIANILKGGGAFPSPLGITCGSTMFWVANAVMIGWIIFVSIMVRSYLIQKTERKVACGYQYVEGDIKWDRRATIVYPGICCLAGFFAGMFGIGGGIVKGPLMLTMGVHPAVSSASSACMILFTSFTATTSFVVFGLLIPDYATICFTVGFISTFFGQIGLGYLMRRAKRNSYIAFSIGGVVLLSAILMTIQSLLSMLEGEHHSSGGICGNDE